MIAKASYELIYTRGSQLIPQQVPMQHYTFKPIVAHIPSERSWSAAQICESNSIRVTALQHSPRADVVVTHNTLGGSLALNRLHASQSVVSQLDCSPTGVDQPDAVIGTVPNTGDDMSTFLSSSFLNFFHEAIQRVECKRDDVAIWITTVRTISIGDTGKA